LKKKRKQIFRKDEEIEEIKEEEIKLNGIEKRILYRRVYSNWFYIRAEQQELKYLKEREREREKEKEREREREREKVREREREGGREREGEREREIEDWREYDMRRKI